MAPRGCVLLGLCVLGALSMVAAEKTNMEECTAFTFSSNKGTKVLKNLPADKLAQMKGSVDSWQKWKGKTETSVSQIMIEFNANKMANKEREANGEGPDPAAPCKPSHHLVPAHAHAPHSVHTSAHARAHAGRRTHARTLARSHARTHARTLAHARPAPTTQSLWCSIRWQNFKSTRKPCSHSRSRALR